MANLPDRPSLEHLKGQAKQLLKRVHSQEEDALTLVGPYFGDPARITLQQAQLVVAREYGFSSWTRLKRHVDAGLGDRQTTEQWANRFLDLVCLHYGPDATRGPAEFEKAAAILAEHPEIVSHSPHVAAACGDQDAIATWLASQPHKVDDLGGPFQWTPLMYAAYARLPGASSFAVGSLLVTAGADPNFHYLWGGTYRFTVLTGIFGDGEGGKTRLPEHPDMAAFARLVLEAGANPNESQGAYNRCFSPDNTHLDLMLEYGLKDSDPSNWWQAVDGARPDTHRTMHWNLIIALRWGFAERARLLIEHGVDITTPDTNSYPTFTEGFTPYQSALLRGLPEIAELIKSKGGDASPLPERAQFYAACMSGDLETAQRLKSAHMGHSTGTEAEMLREAAGNGRLDAVRTMIALGFELSPRGSQTPLHAAAWRGQVAVLEVLLAAGADAKLRDPEHHSPPLGHALHAQQKDAIALLMDAEMDIFTAASVGNLSQIEARLADDPNWLDAKFEDVLHPASAPCDTLWVTPVWRAALNGQWDSVKYLVQRGADLSVPNPNGQTLAEYAEECGQTDLLGT
ncbi:MAG: ankyrin repeat domain-containing protein [Pseudomonadota bacterium]